MTKANYSTDFKLKVLKDKYTNNLSVLTTARKYGIKSSRSVCAWEKKFPVGSKALSLSDDIIQKVRSMDKNKKRICTPKQPQTREEQLSEEVENLRKALAYSELRNEALLELLKIGKETYGIDLIKKAGAKQ